MRESPSCISLLAEFTPSIAEGLVGMTAQGPHGQGFAVITGLGIGHS
jgi:hypothetical protein